MAVAPIQSAAALLPSGTKRVSADVTNTALDPSAEYSVTILISKDSGKTWEPRCFMTGVSGAEAKASLWYEGPDLDGAMVRADVQPSKPMSLATSIK